MAKRFLLYFAGLYATACIFPANTQGQSTESITNTIERAYTLMNDVYAELNYNNTVGDVSMHVRGTYYYPGIPDEPASVREYLMSAHVNFSDGGTSLVRKDTFTRIGQDAITSFYDITEDQMNITIADEAKTPTEADRAKYLYESLMFCPNILLQYILRDASNSNFVSTVGGQHIVRHNNASGNVYFLYINSNTYLLERIVQPMYDPVSGDYFRTTKYDEYDLRDGYQVPGKITVSKDSTLLYKLSVDYKEILPRVDYGSVRLSQMKTADWLYIIPMEKWDSRAVLADMDDYLVVFEPPATAEAGYTLLDNIKKAYGNKEIRYCVVSHFHAEHMGGVRPFMEDGAMIVTTEANKEYFMQMSRNKHMFSKDVRLKKFISPKFLFVKSNKQQLRANNKEIQFLLLNKKSRHADEYIVSYIPSEKILIENDLVETTKLRERDLNRQEKGLVEFLDDSKVNVKQIIQAYPYKNTPNIFDYDKIKPESKLIKGSKKILEVFE